MTEFRVYTEKLVIEGTEITSYGIAAIDENSFVVSRVGNVSSSKEKAEKLCLMCESLKLSPCHLKDAVEDYIISDIY